MNAALGGALVFLAAVLLAGYVTAAKPVISQMGSALFTSVAMSSASVFILMHFAIVSAGEGASATTPILWALGAALAIPCTVFPSFMISEAIARIGPGLTSAIGGIGPVATAIFAVAILNEPFGWAHAVALVFATCGILLLSRTGRAYPKEINTARVRQ